MNRLDRYLQNLATFMGVIVMLFIATWQFWVGVFIIAFIIKNC